MLTPLHIPLGQPQTTRRADRRVVVLSAAIVIGIILGLLLARLPYVSSPTLALGPENATISIRLLKTPSNQRLIEEHLHGVVPLEGLPLTLPAFLRLSNREMTLHVDADGGRSLAIDTELSEQQSDIISSFGYRTWIGNGKTLVSPKNMTVRDTGIDISLAAFLPWHDGDITIFSPSKNKAAIALTNAGLKIQGFGVSVGDYTPASIPTESTVVAVLRNPEEWLQQPHIAESTQSIAEVDTFLSLLTNNNASVVLTRDGEGIGYFVSIRNANMSVEEIAALGKDLLNRHALSTQVWTSADGEEFLELRANNAETAVDVRAEENFTFITLQSNNGETLRITKTPELLTISNRAIAIDDASKPVSACLGNAHTWVSSSELAQLVLPNVEGNQFFQDILRSTNEIAMNSRIIRMCW